MRVLACGGRDYLDRAKVHTTLDDLDVTILICGMARGADSLAYEWAKLRRIPVDEYPADWRDGRGAGAIRNVRMLDEGRPDLVVAFPGGRGTAHCVTAARWRRIEVLEVE